MGLMTWTLVALSMQSSAFRQWAEGQPNNRNGEEHCLQVGSGGSWWDVACDQKFWFACQGQVDGSTLWRVSRQKGQWKDGERVCRGEFGPAFRFAVPQSDRGNRALRVAMGERTPVWAALSDAEREGAWLPKPDCSSGACVLQNWADNQPNNRGGAEHCIQFGGDGAWWDARCSESYRVACRHRDRQQWRVTSSTHRWWDAHEVCPNWLGEKFRFAVPRGGPDHLALQDAADGEAVWVNFSDEAAEGLFKQDMCASDGSCPFFLWASGQPDNVGEKEHYTLMDAASGTWSDVTLQEEHPVACRNQNDASEWRVTNGRVDWDSGNEQCQLEFGQSFFFDVPRSASDNDRLARLAAQKDTLGSAVFLNIHDRNTENVWLSQPLDN